MTRGPNQPWWRQYGLIALAVMIGVILTGCALVAVGISIGLPRMLRTAIDAATPLATLDREVFGPTDTVVLAMSPTAKPTETATSTRAATPTESPTPRPTSTSMPTPTIAMLVGPAAELLRRQTPTYPPQHVEPTPRSGSQIGSIPTKPAPQPAPTWTTAPSVMPSKVNVANTLAVNHWRFEITSVVFEPYLGIPLQDVILLGTLTNEGMQTDTFVAASMMRLRDSRGELHGESLPCTVRIPERYLGLTIELPEDMAPGETRFIGVCFLVPSDETSFTIVPGSMARIWSGDIAIAHPAERIPDVDLIAQLELVSLRGFQSASGDFYVVKGEIRNISSASLESVEAVATVFDDQFRFLASKRAFIARDPLQPGSTSTFQVMLPYDPQIAHFRVEFMSRGTRLRTRDAT